MFKKILKICAVPFVIILSKLSCFVFDALLGAYYGAGITSDAFLMAYSLPTILFEGIATAILTCYIPIYISFKCKEPEKINDFSSNIFNISLIFGIIISVLFIIFRKVILGIYAHGFSQEAMRLLNDYAVIIIWSIPFIASYSIFKAYLQIQNAKAISAIAQVVSYVVLIIALLLTFPSDIKLAWAAVMGHMVSFGVLLLFAFGKGFKYCPVLSLRQDYLKTMAIMIFPVFVSSVVSEVNSVADKFFASHYEAGIITSMTYGYKLSFSIQGIVSSSLVIIAYSSFTKKAAQNDLAGLNSQLYKCIQIVSWTVFPLVIGGIVIAGPIIQLVYGHGNFSGNSVNITAAIFSVYLLGVMPMCMKHIGDRICCALQRTDLAMYTALITVGVNIFLDIAMSKRMEYIGLVWATGIAILAGSIAVFIMLKTVDNKLSLRQVVKELIKPFVLSLIMGICVWIIQEMLSKTQLYRMKNGLFGVMICVLTGAAIYLGMSIALYKKK